MSETRIESAAGLIDETGRKITNNETAEPLVRYMQEHPVCVALSALGIGFLLGKML